MQDFCCQMSALFWTTDPDSATEWDLALNAMLLKKQKKKKLIK
jgi:hypothetical protein